MTLLIDEAGCTDTTPEPWRFGVCKGVDFGICEATVIERPATLYATTGAVTYWPRAFCAHCRERLAAANVAWLHEVNLQRQEAA